ncbi:uncharacterized protein LOC142639566 [Castanea sativa]|uniref:uncharacterized protein LOC142639566 n=1 Tax=Castanea sativa TaxID=21020 RepID=UPI003F65040B
MKGFMEATREVDPYLTGLSPKDTGGQTWKGKRKRSFPKAVWNKRWLLVGTNYFTKWVEAEPLANIKDIDAKKFTETVNQVIVNGLKKRLDGAKDKWVEELPHILWTYRITPHRSIRETPFSMTYGAKAVIPFETRFPTLRTSSFTPNNNNGLLEKSLDLIEERREIAMVQLAYYQHKLKQGYHSNLRLRPLSPGDLVLRKVLGTEKTQHGES